MKKIFLVVLSLITVFGLSACKKEEAEIVFEVPNETYVNIQELPYAEYLKLSNPVVTISVHGMGDIKIQLFPSVAKGSVDNFIQYILDEAYTDNGFHRVINGFMIQGGILETPECGIVGEMNLNPDFTSTNELSHSRGVLSMARIGTDYNSATSQFFIMNGSSANLDGYYAAFGGVVSGFNVLDFIAGLNDAEVNELPSSPVYIDGITVELNGYVTGDRVCAE
ncbi:MAG: peptidylprolyl isomerase [Firmicutes bacterium]|nr:peptidylprolyl isomerase [Bacillota bacterium]